MSGSFTKYHLGITKAEYERRQYQQQDDCELVPLAPAQFQGMLSRVGGPWGWDRRPAYSTEIANTFRKFADPDTALYLLKKGGVSVGYSMVCKPSRESEDLIRSPGNQNYKVLEIENFGLFPEHNAKGYGKLFFPLLLGKLFGTAQAVYLSTRSTNHARVVPFYQGLGMSILKQETLANDLLPLAHPKP